MLSRDKETFMKAATRPTRSAASNPGLRGKLAIVLLASGLLGAVPPSAHAVDGGPTVTIGSSVPDAATGTTIISDIKIVYPGGNASTIVIGKLKIKVVGDYDCAETLTDALKR